MKCVYKLILDGEEKEFASEAILDKAILDNITDYLDFAGLNVRYRKTFGELTKQLDLINYTNSLELANDRVIARELGRRLKIDPTIEDVEDVSNSGYISVLDFSTSLTTPFDQTNYELNLTKLIVENPNLLKTMLPSLRDTNLDLSTISEDLRREYAKQVIAYNLKTWEYLRGIGRGLHYVLSVLMNLNIKNFERLTITDIKEYIKTHNLETEIPGITVDNIPDEVYNSFINLLKDVRRLIMNRLPGTTPKIYTDFVITGETVANEKLRGKFDVMVVYENGNVDIYDLKVSTKQSADWDVGKQSTYNYLLGFYRRLLEKLGIPFSSINLKILPVLLTLDKETIGTARLDFLETEAVVLSDVESKLIGTIIPIDVKVNISEIENTVEKKLVEFFPSSIFNKSIVLVTENQIRKSVVKTGDKYVITDPRNLSRQAFYDTEEEIELAIKDLLQYYASRTQEATCLITNEFSTFLELLNSGDISELAKKDLTYSLKYKDTIKLKILQLLRSYSMTTGWKVLKGDEFIAMGVIVLVNDITHTIDIVNITNANLYEELNLGTKNLPGYTITSNLQSLAKAELNSDIMTSTIGNIETIKAITIANEIIKEDELKDYALGLIKTISTAEAATFVELKMTRAIDYYDKLCSLSGNERSSIRIEDSFSRVVQTLIDIKNSGEGKIAMTRNKDKFTLSDSSTSSEDRLTLLIRLRDHLYAEYYKEGKVKPTESSAENHLYQLVIAEIAAESGTTIDIMNSNNWDKYGFSLKAFKLKRALNGTDLQTLDTIPIIAPIHRLLNNANSVLTGDYSHYKNRDRSRVKQFLDRNMSVLSNKVVSIQTEVWKLLIDLEATKSHKYRTKNPWTDTTLSKENKDFLIYWLEDLNAERYSTEQIELAKLDGTYFDIPLMRASYTSRILNKGGIIKTMHDKFGEAITNPRNETDSVEANRLYVKKNMELDLMYNEFNSLEVILNRDRRLHEVDPLKEFETNLLEVKDAYKLSKMREKAYNKIIPAINAAIVLLQFNLEITGKDSSTLLEFIIDYMNSSVYNSNLIKGEGMMEAAKAVNAIRSISSAAILGFNFTSGIKETVTGLWTLYNRATANSLFDKDKIGLADMMKAYSYVFIDSVKLMSHVSLFEYLNRTYSMSNMDVSSLVEEANYNAADAFRFRARMFWCNRAPDFLNRVTIMIGYMNKYNCLDAYSITDDLVVYDWKKDGRFKLLATNNLSNKEKYNLLKALYLRMKEEFVKLGKRIEDPVTKKMRDYTLEDDLPDAFTELEANRMRLESNTLFGYMDHTNKSLWFRRGLGVIIGQFMTYLSAKKNLYFLERKQHGDGLFIHVVNAKGEPLYWKTIEENGRSKKITTTEVTDDPLVDWKGKITEGILWSIIDLVNVTNPEAMKESFKDPIKWRNLFIATHDLLMIWLLSWIMRLIAGGENPKSLSFGSRLTYKIAANMKGDINIWQTLTGAVDFLFTSFKFVKGLAIDVINVCTGDMTITRLIVENLSVLRPLSKEIYAFTDEALKRKEIAEKNKKEREQEKKN